MQGGRARRWIAAAGAAAVVGLTGVPAVAAEASARVAPERKVGGASFEADPATGDAWVAVTLVRRFATGKEARARGERVGVRVDGLGFDPRTGAIVLDDGGRRVACAVVRGDRAEPTGLCTLDARIVEREVDTGFGAAPATELGVRVASQ